MNTRVKAGLGILAAIGAFSSIQFISGAALAQGGGGGGQGGGFGGGGQRRPMMSNMTAKVTIDDAIKTATAKTAGYVNSAALRPVGPGAQGEPPKMVWVIHVVTTPGTPPGPNGTPGKGENIAVDATSNQVVDMPQPPPGGGFGGGRGGGGNGGPPPPGGN